MSFEVLRNVGSQVFGSLGDHMLDTNEKNNHAAFTLIKACLVLSWARKQRHCTPGMSISALFLSPESH